MSCESWQDWIALDAGGNLPKTEATALERHLRGCVSCRRYADDIAASQSALQRFSELPLEEASLSRIRKGVLEHIADEPLSSDEQSTARARRAAPWLALAAGIALVLFLWPSNPRQPSPESEQASAGEPSLSSPPDPLSMAGEGEQEALPPPSPAMERRVGGVKTSPSTSPSPEIAPPRRGLIELHTTNEPLKPAPGLVIFDLPEPQPSSLALVVPPGSETTSPGPVILDLAQAPGEPILRRVSEHNDYAIYWLTDPLKEKEHAHTKIF